MKGDKVVKAGEKFCYFLLFANRRWFPNIHFGNHFKSNGINCSFCSHFHCTVIKSCWKEVVKIFAPNVLKIRHFIASLVQIKLTVYIVKYSAYITVTDCYNRFAIIEVFIALNRNIRPYVKWVYSIFDLVLCIAFSCTYIAKLFCLTLFPRKSEKMLFQIRFQQGSKVWKSKLKFDLLTLYWKIRIYMI